MPKSSKLDRVDIRTPSGHIVNYSINVPIEDALLHVDSIMSDGYASYVGLEDSDVESVIVTPLNARRGV